MSNLNAKGPLFAVQKLTPFINKGGSVVFTTSIANVKGMAGQVAYGAVKPTNPKMPGSEKVWPSANVIARDQQ